MIRNVIVFCLLCLNVTIVQGSAADRCAHLFLADQRLAALQECLPLAQTGDRDAAFILARVYAKGVEGEPDWIKAVEWVKISAANGHPEAAYNLAIAFERGKGTPRDIAKAIEYYHLSAEAGNGKAMRNLAALYEKGEFVSQDLAFAFELFQRSAETGLSDSQLKTGIMQLNGIGTKRNPIAARYWFDSAARAGHHQAQLALGVLLIELDPVTAVYWYKQAVAQGNPYAAHNLSLYYSGDKNPTPDLLMALAYAETSISLGNKESQALYDRVLRQIQAAPDPGNDKSFDLLWLKQQPSDRLVIQLARLENAAGVDSFIQQYRLEQIARVIKLKTDNDIVVLYNRDFANEAAARKAITRDLPERLASEAWVRSYRSLY